MESKSLGQNNKRIAIEEALNSNNVQKEAIISGRIIGILDGEGSLWPGLIGDLTGEQGFILKDETEKVVVLTDKKAVIGSIVEIKVGEIVSGHCQLLGEIKVLVECEDFYISLKSSPNYKKMALDLNLLNRFKERSKILASIRGFFYQQNFVETDTPCLVKLPGMEPYLDVFKTKFEANFDAQNKMSEEMYLITSPEYAMKKLLVGGLEKIFQITKSFRNKETFSDRHNPEFAILEWYRAYASYREIMDDTENLVKCLWRQHGKKTVNGDILKMNYKNQEIDVMAKWERLTVLEVFQKWAGITEEEFFNLEKLRAAVLKKGYQVDRNTSFDDLFYLIFLNEIEPKLGTQVPLILHEYPVSMAALSQRCERDERLAERFEVYIGGLELCNAFTELNDPAEQERRFKAEREERIKLGKDVYDVDKTFIEALKFGMPPAGGNALGIDRLIMLILGVEDIRDIIYFPQRDL